MEATAGITIYMLFFLASALAVIYSRDKTASYPALTRIIAYLLPLSGYFLGVYDELSLVFLSISAPIALLVSLYNTWYSVTKYSDTRLILLIDLFGLTIIYTFIAPNMISFILLWTVSEILGFLLVCFEGGDEALRAGYRFFFLKGFTFELSALTTLIYLAGTVGLTHAMLTPFWMIPRISIDPGFSVLILTGFLTTSAIIPLHFWLPHAHSIAPSTASALLSGLTVKMGFYGILRFYSFLAFPTIILYGILVLSVLTAIYGFSALLAQKDIKRILAYSTIGNTGFIGFLLAAYLIYPIDLLFYALAANIFAHALYKSSLFMNTGTVIALTHKRRVDELGGLVVFTPYSSLAVLLSILSVFGVPPTIGFVGKLLAIIALLGVGDLVVSSTGLFVVAYSILISIIYGYEFLSIHWKPAGPAIKSSSNHVYPQIIELVLSSLSIVYGLLFLLFMSYRFIYLLLIVNAVSLLVLFALIAVFYQNIRVKIMKGMGVFDAS